MLLPFFHRKWATDHILTDVVFFTQIEHLSNLPHSLWPESRGNRVVCESWDIIFSFFHNHQIHHREIPINNTSSDTFSLPFTLSPWPVTRVSLRKKKANSSVGHDTLFHRKTLLVVTTSDSHHITLQKAETKECSNLNVSTSIMTIMSLKNRSLLHTHLPFFS